MTALQNLDAERSVLGAILLDGRHLTDLTVDEHLLPEHFSDPSHAVVYRAALDLANEDQAIDYLTVAARLRDMATLGQAGGQDAVEALTAWVPASGNVREYGRIVRERHQARKLLGAVQQIQADVTGHAASIDELLERAAQLVTEIAQDGRHGREQHSWSPEQLKSDYFDALGQPAGAVWKTPFSKINEWLDGGLRPAELTLLGGHEKHGKSVIADQILEELADQDARVHLYINEMNRRGRMNRMISRLSGVSVSDLRARNLDTSQAKRVAKALDRIKVGITECHGWTAAEISQHIKRHRWDACCVDIAHNIPKTEPGTEGATAIAQTMRDVSLQAETQLVVVVHLNRSRAGEPPVLSDIRDTGMWEKLADQVLFIHRDKDADGMFLNTAVLNIAAAREGQTGLMKVNFDPAYRRFLPAADLSLVKGVRADQYVPSPDARTQSQPEEVVSW